MSNGNGNHWGIPNRPKLGRGFSSPDQRAGSDGDVQIKQTNLGAQIFGKVNGSWYGASLTATEGDPATRIGSSMANHLSIDRDSVDIFRNDEKIASFGSTTTVKDLNLTGKIAITSTGTQNVCIGTGNNDVGTDNISIGVDAGSNLGASAVGCVFIGTEAGIGNIQGDRLIAIGKQSAGRTSTNEFRGDDCIAIGTEAMQAQASVVAVAENIAIGNYAMEGLASTTSFCTCIGYEAGKGINANSNICIGGGAGNRGITGDSNILIGVNADINADATTNAIAFGDAVTAVGSNTVTLGNVSCTKVYMAQDQGAAAFVNYINMLAPGGDPTEPAEGHAIIWISNGSSKGDAGDIMMASHPTGGSTTYGTIFDHSDSSAW